jgi:sialate O-acetylesterase
MKNMLAKNPSLGFPGTKGDVQPAFTLYAWNEFGEGGFLAPTNERGHSMLQAVKDVFGPNHVRAKSGEKFGVAGVYTNHMVLQRDKPLPIWGSAEPGTEVTVSFGGHVRKATAKNGHWRVELPPMPASSEPRTFSVSRNNGPGIEYVDVLVGDVWFASGQSNMEMSVGGAKGGRDAITASANPLLRFYKVDRQLAHRNKSDASWRVAGPKSSHGMTAVGYYFAKEIQKTQKIPIGLLQCAFGGTVTETWCGPRVLEESYPEWESWSARKRSRSEGDLRNVVPSFLYHRMVSNVMPFAVKGIIWYQGSANVARTEEQKRLLPAMARDWRRSWGDETMPFYFVQLPRYERGDWHEFRRVQLEVSQQLPNSGMAITIDLAKDYNPKDHPIHPRTKAPIGHRLALLARAKTYGESDLVHSGPIARSMTVNGQSAELTFDHVGSGLVTSDGRPLRGFYVSGDGRTFVAATATIRGNRVAVQADGVTKPVAVRYGAEADVGKTKLDVNLGNAEKLPASPFTIGK